MTSTSASAPALDVIDLTRELIAAPSPNPGGDERAVVRVLQSALARLGLPAGVVHARTSERPNLVVTLDFGAGGRHLALCGHIDTKPVGDAHWTVDPFSEPVRDGRLYGLGAADMKSAIAAMLIAASRVRQEPPLGGRLSLVLVADEEDGAAYGAQHLTRLGLVDADAVVIGEPGGMATDFDRLHVVSRGIARMRIAAEGRQGHSSLSGEPATRNAGVDVARAVVAVADELEVSTPANADDLTGWEATVNTALAFKGGVGYGVLPGVMSVDTEVRLLPGMDRKALETSIAGVLQRVGDRTGARLSLQFDQPPNDWLPAAQVDVTDPLVGAARRACASALGHVPALAVFPGTTDATWFSGVQGLPTLPALGPGLLARAHGADEWVSVDAVKRTVDLYTDLVREYLAPDLAGGANDGTAD